MRYIKNITIIWMFVLVSCMSMTESCFAPQVYCNPVYFNDITEDYVTNALDFLTVIGEYGQSVEPDHYCIDGLFSTDSYVDLYDVMAWDWVIDEDRIFLNELYLTGGSGNFGWAGAPVELPVLSDLLIAGKRGSSDDPTKLKDRLYTFDSNGLYEVSFAPASERFNIRLVRSPRGELYQLNSEAGVLRLDDTSEVIIPTGEIVLSGINEPRYGGSATVYVGIQGVGEDRSGRPILDATFDGGYVYVVPVVVEPVGEEPYTAAAKLELEPGETPPYDVVMLYDDPNAADPGDSRELNSLREIELDNTGNLYVINAHALNESDILWVYDADTGAMEQRLYLCDPNNPDVYIPAPLGMHVSNTTGTLYLASSQNPADASSTMLCGLSTVNLSLERSITINGMGHVTGICEDPTTGTIYVAGFMMEDIPEYIYPDEPPFYDPYLAEVPSESSNVTAVCLSDPNNDLAMPLSIVWTGVEIIYVDDDANGANNGTSWDDAYIYLQDALCDPNLVGPAQIWVAEGTYKPDQGGGQAPGNRGATFQLINDVAVYGGFPSGGGNWASRNPNIHQTILSGDINGDDEPNWVNNDENSNNVVRGSATVSSAILDGFTIKAGNANVYPYNRGGGMYNDGGSPTVNNCKFKNNSGEWGGGMWNYYSSPTVTNCTFSGNSSTIYSGGGMGNRTDSNPLVSNCNFIGNSAEQLGGGMRNDDSSNPVVANCSFRLNVAGTYGGGIGNTESSPTVTNCIFIGNFANGYYGGGGIYNAVGSSPVVTNCVLIGNSTDKDGGGMSNVSSSNPTLINCTFTNNSAIQLGGGICNDESSPILTNCILWGDTPNEIYNYNGTATVTYSDVQGGWAGVGNIDVNPQFKDTEGHLFSSSPCRNTGDPTFVPDPNVPFDIDGDPRVIEGWVDMGADELYPPIRNIDTGVAYDTIQDAIDDANNGDTIVIQEGIYTGEGNKGINFLGKSITLRSTDPNDPNVVAATIIDCENSFHGFEFFSGEDANSVLDGFTIANGYEGELYGAGIYCDLSSPTISHCIIRNNDAWMGGGIYCWRSNPIIKDCVIKNNTANEGGGIYCENSSPTINGGTIRDNSPDGISLDYDSTVQILGTVRIISNNFVGDGFVNIDPVAALNLDDAEIFANMVGVGTMQVDLGALLTIDGEAVIDLGDPCDPNVRGTIDCEGVLEVRDNARITNANINISRASFTDDVNVSNSVITVDAIAPYGQFFIDANAIFINNDIFADGDRYMNLDPNIFSGLFVHNRIFVTITEGVGQTRGGLFECRGDDGLTDVNSCDPNNTFFCRANPGTIPDCNTKTWTLERLELVPGAKVNLTNRYPFQPPYDPGDDYDVVYVKELILRQDSVLNTSYNTIYYDNLIKEPNAVIKNEPLLGFSMINIAFDDQVEFIARVTHNNYTDPNLNPPDYSRTHVKRVVGLEPDPNGMMRMLNIKDLDPNSPHYLDIKNARAKGLFSQSNEDEILIWFQYLFENSDPNTELVIYLTDVPELLDHNDPCRADHYIEVACLYPPPPNWPGSVDSGCFGTFQQYVSSQDLDFIRGTRLEFELIGPQDTSVLINNWDPQVHCSVIYCADVTGDVAVTVLDFLTVVGGCGGSADLTPEGDSTVCLDGVFSDDGMVDSDDISSWDWLLNSPDRLNLCGVPLIEGMEMSGAPAGVPVGSEQIHILSELPVSLSDLIIAGKRGTSTDSTKLKDYLYVLDDQGQYIDGFEPVTNRANTKLVKDADGELYQLNYEDGLIRLSDENSIVPSGTFLSVSEPRYESSATVYVGLQGEADNWSGRPIADAAFDADGYLYVVPVVVEPVGGEDPYTAAAKLVLEPEGTPPYSVVRLYDDPDADLPGDNRELNALREIEVDNAGNLYVVNAHTLNDSDILWKYDIDTGVMQDRIYLSASGGAINIPAPIAMCLAENDSLLYLASSENEPEAGSVLIYGLSTDTFDLERTITVNGMGHVTSIAEDPVTGTLWITGFIMEDIPEYLYSNEPPFYDPYLAEVPSDNNDVQAVSLAGVSDLALPLSIKWTGITDICEGADLNGSNGVDFIDFAILAYQWLQSPGSPSADIAPETPDGLVDMLDLKLLIEHWLETGCHD